MKPNEPTPLRRFLLVSGLSHLVFLALLIAGYLAWRHAPDQFARLWQFLSPDKAPSTIKQGIFIYRILNIFTAREIGFYPILFLFGILLVGWHFIIRRLRYKTSWPLLLFLVVIFFVLGINRLFFLVLIYYLVNFLLASYLYAGFSPINRDKHIMTLFAIPVIGPLFFSGVLAHHYRKTGNKSHDHHLPLYFLLTLLTALAFHFHFFPTYCALSTYNDVSILSRGSYYNIIYNSFTNRLIVSDKGEFRLVSLIADQQGLINYNLTPIYSGPFEHLAGNQKLREIYYFDKDTRLLYIFDKDTLVAKEKYGPFSEIRGVPSLAANDRGDLFLVAGEDRDVVMLFDRAQKKSIYLKSHYGNHDVLYNPFQESFVLTFHSVHKHLQIIHLNPLRAEYIAFPRNQLNMELSRRRREIYIALSLKGQIAIVDADTMAIKRRLPSVAAVRSLAYDERNDILFAGSMVSGQTQIIDLKHPDNSYIKYTAYYQRDIALDTLNRQVFIASSFGIYRFSY